MKPDPRLNKFINLLDQDGFALNPVQKDQITTYVNLLNYWNHKINLVSRTQTSLHVYNNLAFSAQFLEPANTLYSKGLYDVGSGGGFPGILLSIMYPQSEITLIDSNQKKIRFLDKVIRELKLTAKTEYRFLEKKIDPEEDKVFCVTALAFTALDKLIELARPRLLAGGRVLTLKGDNYRTELSSGEKSKNVQITEKVSTEAWQSFCPLLKDKRLLILEF